MVTRRTYSKEFKIEAVRLLGLGEKPATQHYAINDYPGQRRLMCRTAFTGPTPAELAA